MSSALEGAERKLFLEDQEPQGEAYRNKTSYCVRDSLTPHGGRTLLWKEAWKDSGPK
jgi:hypothetical protein